MALGIRAAINLSSTELPDYLLHESDAQHDEAPGEADEESAEDFDPIVAVWGAGTHGSRPPITSAARRSIECPLAL